MDAIDLLARENEFKKLNKQLEKKTESLMKEIEHVMQKQDFFAEFSPNLTQPARQNYKKHCCTTSSQPETPVKKNFKKKSLKLSSPKSLDSEESDFEIQSTSGITDSVFESQNLDKKRQDSDFVSQNLNKNKENSDNESQNLYKNKHDSDNESQNLNKNRRNSGFESKPQNIRKKDNHRRVICDCCPQNKNSFSDGMEFLYAFVNINVKDKVLPPSFSKEGRVSVESVCKFLSSKIKLMQEQMDKLQSTIEKKALQCESHLTQLAELESERMTLLNRTNNMKCSSADMRAKYLATQKRLEEKEKQYKEQRSEIDKQLSELRRLRTKNASVEAKSASQEQTIDNLKQQLEMCKRSEKELRDSARQLSSTYESAISRLEAQVSTLTARAHKQSALTDNLRKQNALLTAGGALDSLHVEYAGFLNQEF